MAKSKNQPIYFNPEEPLQISFVKNRKWKRATKKSGCSFEAYIFNTPEEAAIVGRFLLEVGEDCGFVAWEPGLPVLAQSRRKRQGQEWIDLREPTVSGPFYQSDTRENYENN